VHGQQPGWGAARRARWRRAHVRCQGGRERRRCARGHGAGRPRAGVTLRPVVAAAGIRRGSRAGLAGQPHRRVHGSRHACRSWAAARRDWRGRRGERPLEAALRPGARSLGAFVAGDGSVRGRAGGFTQRGTWASWLGWHRAAGGWRHAMAARARRLAVRPRVTVLHCRVWGASFCGLVQESQAARRPGSGAGRNRQDICEAGRGFVARGLGVWQLAPGVLGVRAHKSGRGS
jgi:hypothetical protein